ncbi:hypothetical protein [Leifsonia aquatica]|uniref:hypothetical protein n=1 Tax=Leifsonia aquatica TaxID=144185 RepID=UPI0028B1A373|nr:hypothetical protein [Leifsonia aquatica]
MDAYWEPLDLVVEFHERQHSQAVPHFDKLDVITVSGVPRGGPNGQRRRYDLRRETLIPEHGLHLVIISITAFTVKRHHIVPDPVADAVTVQKALAGFL